MDDLLNRMSSHLLTEWMAYHSLEPFGDELIDIHFAELKAIVINVNKTKGLPVDAKKYRLWKQTDMFDPQQYFDQLKAALTFKEQQDE